MTSGMAHISGGIMAAYIAFGIEAGASPDRGHHDRARHVDDGKTVRARRRKCRRRAARSRSRVEKTDVQRHRRRPAAVRRRACDLRLNVGAMPMSVDRVIAVLGERDAGAVSVLSLRADSPFRLASRPSRGDGVPWQDAATSGTCGHAHGVEQFVADRNWADSGPASLLESFTIAATFACAVRELRVDRERLAVRRWRRTRRDRSRTAGLLRCCRHVVNFIDRDDRGLPPRRPATRASES